MTPAGRAGSPNTCIITQSPTNDDQPAAPTHGAAGFHPRLSRQRPFLPQADDPPHHHKRTIAAGKTATLPSTASSPHKRGLHEEEILLATLTVVVLAALAGTGYFATTIHNFRPVAKVLDPEIPRMHHAWATRTAPGQPTLQPNAYIDDVKLWVYSDNDGQLRALHDWINDQGYHVDRANYIQGFIHFRVDENALYPLAKQVARWPTVRGVDMSTRHPDEVLNSRNDGCVQSLINAIRDDSAIKTRDDAQHIYDELVDKRICGSVWRPTELEPTAENCLLHNPVLNIHRRAIYDRLIPSHNGIDAFIHNQDGNVLNQSRGEIRRKMG